MPETGFFVTLYDKDTLQLYLERGIYGQLMSPVDEEPSGRSSYYPTLADYGCAREGDHIFFFRKRTIYYGGQIVGSNEHGAFYLNGPYSPLGREADAPLVWDESSRDRYNALDQPGLFEVETRQGSQERCQPFLIQFEDQRNLAGTKITSDELYFELGEYPFPLPSNTMSNMGFRSISPGETRILLNLLENSPEGELETDSDESVTLNDDPTPYTPALGIDDCSDADPESHLEAAIISNPSLLPEALQPENATLCRQVPISPLKPSDMDLADVCYYTDTAPRDGTFPNHIIELKKNRAGANAARQVKRYCRWLDKRFSDIADSIDIVIFAPGYKRTFDDPQYIGDYADRVTQWEFNSNQPVSENQSLSEY